MSLLRAIFALLAIALVSGGALPSLARLAVGATHVCHCRTSSSDCVCIKCHPDRPDFALSEESIQGQCGDDEDVPTSARFRATLPPSLLFVMQRPRPMLVTEIEPALLASCVSRAPPLPPPKRA